MQQQKLRNAEVVRSMRTSLKSEREFMMESASKEKKERHDTIMVMRTESKKRIAESKQEK